MLGLMNQAKPPPPPYPPHYGEAATVHATEQWAVLFARHLPPAVIVYLSGDLGIGKTTWVRAFLRQRGEAGTVASPSFALAYSYNIGGGVYHHLDCYRMQHRNIGDDLLELITDNTATVIVEWAEMAIDLPLPDIWLQWTWRDKDKRQLKCLPYSTKGESACKKIF